MSKTKKNPEVKPAKTKKVKSLLVENLQSGLKDLNTETLSTGTFSVVQDVPRSDIGKKRISVKIKAENPKFIPMYASKDAACADLVANVSPELHAGQVIHLAPGQVVVVDCGFSMALPSGWEAQIRARSHLAEKGVQVTNSPGTIDADYRGPVKVILNNAGKEIVNIEHGKRFAQMAIKPVWCINWNVVDSLDETERNTGGFGSTGT